MPGAPRLKSLLAEIRACQVCVAHLPHGPRPVLRAGKAARLLIIGQAPGRRVHDQSGDTLREWLQLTREQFYDERLVAIVPSGFCNFAEYLPRYFPLPHPSPRNRPWLSRNPWFARDLLPMLRQQVAHVLAK